MAIHIVNTAAEAAIWRGVTEGAWRRMLEFECRLAAYLSVMAQMKQLLCRNSISSEEYAIIDTMFRKKYGLSSFSLFRQKDLISLAD